MTETRSPSEILRAAKARISDKTHWTRYKAARDCHGHYVPPMDVRAVRWCGAGSFSCEMAGESEKFGEVVWSFIERSLPLNRTLATANDFDGHQAVLQIYDKAIVLAEEAAHVDA